MLPTTGFAQSIRPAPDGTGTLINQSGGTIDISGGSFSRDGTNLFHSFQQFGLTQGQIANFLANPSTRNIFGRVVGGDISVINGLLRVSGSNANLFLMNPAGILFGPNARLDLAGDFTATTATRIGFGDNRWFNAFSQNNYSSLVGTPSFFMLDASQSGSIINAGQLSVKNGKSVLLLGQSVVNTGQINAPGGSVTIAAIPGSNRVRISRPGNLLSLEVEPPIADGQPQPFTAADLPTLLTVGAGGMETRTSMTPNNTLQVAGSPIPVPSQPGTAIASGQISVASPSADRAGITPQVAVVGDRVALLSTAINASGINGGGIVRIGGDFKGQGNIPNASQTLIDSSSVVQADGLQQGNGGQVSVWADGTTNFQGTITAKGGNQSGNGGQVEVSGKQTLIFRGTTDLSAANGQVGSLILDPLDIRIVNGDGAADDAEIANGQILQGTSPTATFTISEQALERASATAAIRLEASRNITIDNLADDVLSLAQSTGAVEFVAGNTFSMDPSDRIVTGGAGIQITAPQINAGGLQASNSIQLTGDQIYLNGGVGSVRPLPGTRPNIVLSTQTPLRQVNVEPTSPNPYNTALVDLHANEFAAIQQEQFSQLVLEGGNINIFAADNGNGSRNLEFRTAVVVKAAEAVIVRNLDSLIAPSLTIQAPEFSIQRSSVPAGAIQVGALTVTATVNSDLPQRSNPTQRVIIGGNSEPLVKTNPNDPINANSTIDLDITQEELAAISTPSFSVTTGGDIEIIQPIAVNTNLNFDGANVFLDGDVTASGNIGFSQNLVVRQDANIRSTGGGNIAIGQNILASGSLFVSAGTLITPGSITSDGKDISFQLRGDLTLFKPVLTNGGNFSVDTNGSVRLLAAVQTQGGAIALSGSELNTNVLDTSNPTGQEGNLTLTATTGNVVTGDLNSSGLSGGSVAVNAGQTIQTGQINTSGSFGNGGNVNLRSANDIQVTSINAQGGATGVGGTVSVATDRLFRATGTFQDQNGVAASISTAGGVAGGAVTIQQGGGDLGIPFVIGNASRNGTLGAITTASNNTVSPEKTIPGPFTQGNIRIITKNTPQSEPAKSEPPDLPNCFPNCGLPLVRNLPANEVPTFSYEDIETQFTQEFEDYFGLGEGSVRIKSLLDTRAELKKIRQKAGVRTALVYILFRKPGTQRQFIDRQLLPTEIRKQLKDTAADNDELHILVVTEDGIVVQKRVIKEVGNLTTQEEVPVTFGDVSAAAADLVQYIGVTAVVDSRYTAAATDLYKWLIKPIESELAQVQQKAKEAKDSDVIHLSFLAAKSLRSIPYAALKDPDELVDEDALETAYLDSSASTKQLGSTLLSHILSASYRLPYLVEQYSSGLMPSFSLVDASYKSNLANTPMLAIGFSKFPEEPDKDLLFVPQELKFLERDIWGKDGVKVFSRLNDEAKRCMLQPEYRQELVRSLDGSSERPGKPCPENVGAVQNTDKEFSPQSSLQSLSRKEKKEEIGIIHISTHGEFRTKNDSYLQFGSDKVTLSDIRKLELNSPPPPPIELLTLSACKTALGDPEAELGLAGIAVQSRVKSVTANLWTVSYRSAFVLSMTFYQQLKFGKFKLESNKSKPFTKARALREAQLAMLRGEVRIEVTLVKKVNTDMNVDLDTLVFPLIDKSQSTTLDLFNDFSMRLDPSRDDEDCCRFSHPGFWAGMTIIGNPW